MEVFKAALMTWETDEVEIADYKGVWRCQIKHYVISYPLSKDPFKSSNHFIFKYIVASFNDRSYVVILKISDTKKRFQKKWLTIDRQR